MKSQPWFSGAIQWDSIDDFSATPPVQPDLVAPYVLDDPAAEIQTDTSAPVEWVRAILTYPTFFFKSSEFYNI